MKKIFRLSLFLMLFLLFTTGIGSAHPPSKIALSYDDKEHVLIIDIAHVTNNTRKHHIRKLTLYKNGEELDSYYFTTQSPPGLTEKIPLEAKTGDEIRVKVICSVAGFLEESLTIP